MTKTAGSIVLKQLYLSKLENFFFYFSEEQKAFLYFQHDLHSG